MTTLKAFRNPKGFFYCFYDLYKVKSVTFILLLILISCSSDDKRKENNTIIQTIDVNYASHFELEKSDDSTILIIKDPEGQSIERYSFSKNAKNKIICLSATSIGMATALNGHDQIIGIPNPDYLYDYKLKTLYKKGVISAYGDESALNIERIISSGANVLLYSGFGNSFPNKDKLERFGINVIPIYDWRENKPLGKAEWIKVIAALLNKEKEASDYMLDIAEKYDQLKTKVKGISEKPLVISGNVIGDFWWAPAGESYSAELIRDAGASYIYSTTKGTGSISLTMEDILDADDPYIWLNPGFPTKELLAESNPIAKKLRAFENSYCYSAKMNLYWEKAAIEPHKVLEDLIRIFHPDLLGSGPFHFYQKVDS